MACKLPEAISKIEEILSKNVEGVASAMLSGIQINMLNEAKNNLQSAIEIRMARMQTTTPGSESKRPEFDKLPSYKEGQKNMTYAGIGSRETPLEIQQSMNDVAKELESIGYTLRSGNAIGADKAFEGAPQPWSKDSKGSVKQWSKYSHKVKNKEIFKAENATDKTRKIAKEIHANPTALSGIGLDLMARNTNQIFGSKLDTPVDFVLAWTPLNEQGKPVTKHEDKSYDKDKKAKKARGEETFDTGGTGQAISYASLKGIPVINMADKNWREQLDKVLNKNKTEESKTDTKSSEPEIKYGSVVKYKPENGTEGYYIVRGFSANGGLQLTDSEGKNFSGTPSVNKVKFVKQLEIKRYNNVDYIIDSNNKVYTKNGEVTDKTYINQVLGKNKNESKENDTNSQENKDISNKIKSNLSERQLEIVENAVAKSKNIGMALIFITNSANTDEYGRTFRQMTPSAQDKLKEAVRTHEKFKQTETEITNVSESKTKEKNNNNEIFNKALTEAYKSKEMKILQDSFIGKNGKFSETKPKSNIKSLVNGIVSGVDKHNWLIDSNGNQIELYDPINEKYNKEKQKIIEKYTEGLKYDFADEFNFYNPQLEPDGYNNKYETISKDDIEAAQDIMSNNKKECE